MRFPRNVPKGIKVGFAWLPTKTDSGVWIWLETFRWRVWSPPTGADIWYKETIDE